MKFYRYRTALLVISSFGSLFARVSMDPMWIYKDLPDTEKLYGTFLVRDTSRGYEFNQIFPTDTGNKFDSNYINFDYQFKADSFFIRDPFDTATIVYRSYRPGYAGFKIDWDNGVTGFSLAKFKYLVIAHTGLLPNHKVTVRFGYNSGCGTPTVFQTIGSFAASSAWKIDSIHIPDSIRNVSDSAVKTRSYYEMQVLINNANPPGSPSSGPGNLKMDNIAFADTTRGSGIVSKERRINNESTFLSAIGGRILVNYSTIRETQIRLLLYSSDGRSIVKSYSGNLKPGSKSFVWQPMRRVRTGVYVVKMEFGEVSKSQRVMLFK